LFRCRRLFSTRMVLRSKSRFAFRNPRSSVFRSVVVFGSIASNTAKAHSDVDLMVIGTTGLRQFSQRLSGPEAKPGHEVNPYVLTPEEFTRRANEGDHFITTVLKGPGLSVVGGKDELRSAQPALRI
jgi:hypothetical protein